MLLKFFFLKSFPLGVIPEALAAPIPFRIDRVLYGWCSRC